MAIPGFFKQVKHYFETGEHLPEISIADRVEMARRHLQMEIAWKEVEIVGVMETRRHYTNYFKGIPHFKEYRLKMVTSDTAQEVYNVFDEVMEKFS